MSTTRADIRRWLEQAKTKEATHMIVVCDQFNYEDHPVFVMPGEDPRERKEKLDQEPMKKVMEVYAVFLPWEEQLHAHRSFNYTPAPKEEHRLPNGLSQGSPEDRATWWTCEVCSFTGPFVGTTREGKKACRGSCGGVTPNPACTFEKGST